MTANAVAKSNTELTSHFHHRPRLLPSNKKHHIPLTSIDIVVLKKERLINTILLEGRELDQQVQRTSERFFKNQILLASDLRIMSDCDPRTELDGGDMPASSLGWGICVGLGALRPRVGAAGRAALSR